MVKRAKTTGAVTPADDSRTGPADEPAASGVLGDLIAVEDRVRAAVEAAREQAERVVRSAESEVSSEARAQDADLDAALQELRARIDAEQEAALREIARDSDEAARRYRELGEERVHDLAEQVVRQVAEGRRERGRSEP